MVEWFCGCCADVIECDPYAGYRRVANCLPLLGNCNCGRTNLRVHAFIEKTGRPDEPPKPPVCVDCRFFVMRSERSDGDLMGTCHRFPPPIDGEGQATWPYILGNRGDNWCGEFQPKPLPVPPSETSKVRQTVIEGRNVGETAP